MMMLLSRSTLRMRLCGETAQIVDATLESLGIGYPAISAPRNEDGRGLVDGIFCKIRDDEAH